MFITMIARQAQGVRTGEVITKLAEDAYFMRVDNRVTQVPPVRTHEPRQHGVRNCTRGEQPHNPNRSRASSRGPSQGGNSAGGTGGSRGGASRGAGDDGGSSGGSSSHGAGRRVGGSSDHGGRGHANSHVTSNSHGGYDAHTELKKFIPKRLLKQTTATASPPSPLDFAAGSSQRNSSLSGSPSTT
jgi:hypothetical protein